MRSVPSPVLNGASPAQVFHGERKLRSAVLPNFLTREQFDMNWIGAYRASIHEKQAATMKTLALEQKPPQLNRSVRTLPAGTAKNSTPRVTRRRHAHEVGDHG